MSFSELLAKVGLHGIAADFPNLMLLGRNARNVASALHQLLCSGQDADTLRAECSDGLDIVHNSRAIVYVCTPSVDHQRRCDIDAKMVQSIRQCVAIQHVSGQGRRVVGICNMHLVGASAQMALKKMMESSASTSVFVCSATNVACVDPAIASRCLCITCPIIAGGQPPALGGFNSCALTWVKPSLLVAPDAGNKITQQAFADHPDAAALAAVLRRPGANVMRAVQTYMQTDLQTDRYDTQTTQTDMEYNLHSHLEKDPEPGSPEHSDDPQLHDARGLPTPFGTPFGTATATATATATTITTTSATLTTPTAINPYARGMRLAKAFVQHMLNVDDGSIESSKLLQLTCELDLTCASLARSTSKPILQACVVSLPFKRFFWQVHLALTTNDRTEQGKKRGARKKAKGQT